MSRATMVDGLSTVRRTPPDGGSHTVVLVHGAMDRAASFGRTMRRLDHCDVVAYDRRGYAGSLDAGVAPSIAAHAEDLGRVIDSTGAEAVTVVGHSLGGTIALAAVAAGDERIVSVASFESPAPWLDDSRRRIGGGAVQVAERDGPEAGAEHFYRLMVGDQTWERIRDRDRAARRAEGPALIAELIDLRRVDMSVDLQSIHRHVLVGVGGTSSDHLRAGAVELARWLPDAELFEIAAAGHGAHLTHPGEFATYVRNTTMTTLR